MNQIQEEIAKAVIQLSEKSLITEAVAAKKIRENLKLNGKNKAGLALRDVEEALFFIEENNNLHYVLTVNSANDLLIKPAEQTSALEGDARRRRQSSEKSMVVLTNADVKSALDSASDRDNGKKGAKPYKKRTEKRRMNVNRNYEDWE